MAEAIDDEEAQATNAVVQPEFDQTSDAPEQQQSGDFYCGERKLGQWFYCERPKARRAHRWRGDRNLFLVPKIRSRA